MTATDDRLAQVLYPRDAERQQRAVFAQPGAANEQAGVELVEAREREDLVEDRALAELEQLTERGRAGMAAQGRHVSDRLADEQRWRRDQIDASQAVSEAAGDISARHRAHQRAAQARERMADHRGARPGVRQLSDIGYRRWAQHCADGWNVPAAIFLDDAAYDAWLDDHGSPREDLHQWSPDLDDRDDDTDGM